MFYTTLEEILTKKHINRNFIKKSAKLLLKNVTQTIKNLPMRKRKKNDTKLSIEYWKLAIRNLTHGYPGVRKATTNHTTPVKKYVVCVSKKNWK